MENIALGATDTHKGALDVAPQVAQIHKIWEWHESWLIHYKRRYLIV